MAYIQTTDGVKVSGWNKDEPAGTLTAEEAEASAQERNKRAEDMGIKARYEAVV